MFDLALTAITFCSREVVGMGDEPGRMEKAVQADLDRWGAGVADTALAVSALDLAQRLDVSGVRPAAASMLHTQLRATLLELADLAPEQSESDEVDEVKQKRKQRRERRGA